MKDEHNYLDLYITDSQTKIVDAMQQLDENAGGVLYVVNEKNELVGSLSDGDIRRWIIRTGDIDGVIADVMRKDVRFLSEDNRHKAEEVLKQFSIVSVPVVDKKRHIVDIIKSKSEKPDAAMKSGLQGVPVVVMAGGRGTRLYPYTKILPKPLIPIDGVPILERILERFSEYGTDEFFLTVNYRKEMIRSYFNEVDPTYKIHYIEEEAPLGTAGSLYLLRDTLKQTSIVTNCDILVREDYGKILTRHRESGARMTIVSSVKNTRIPYGVLHVEEDGAIASVEEKPTYSHLINTGMYVIEPEILSLVPSDQVFHMTDLMEELMNRGEKIGMYPISEKSFLDMGEFEEMQRMEEMLKKGEEYEG